MTGRVERGGESPSCPERLSPARPDVAGYERALARHVVAGRVDYGGLSRDAEFARFVKDIRHVDAESATRDERLAFLINAYNALAIQSVLDGLSPARPFGRLRFFLLHRYRIAGRRRTLYGLEHRELIPMGEPRIHFAIVCASASCPRLRASAYRPESLDALLEDDTREFVNDPDRNRFDPLEGIARVSRIFRWYRTDFGGSDREVQAWLAGFVTDPEVAERLAAGTFRLEYLPYDWGLNGTQSERPAGA